MTAETLEAKLANIERHEKAIVRMFAKFIEPDAPFYTGDLVLYGIANRALALSSGFRSMIAARNFVCAAPLLRMQLDTALRLFAARLVSDPADYAQSIFDGKPVDKYRDREGQRLTDGYLANRLSETFPWVKSVYKETSEFVHFTNRHVFASTEILDKETRSLRLSIGPKDRERPEADYFEIVHAFHHVTHLVAEIAAEWHAAIHPDRPVAFVLSDDPPISAT